MWGNLKWNKKTISGIVALLIALTGGYIAQDYTSTDSQVEIEQKQISIDLERVIDGDTIVFDKDGQSQKMRLILIDTPESSTTKTGAIQPYGNEAKEFLSQYLIGKKLTLEYEPSQEKEDKYGRVLAYLFADGVLVQKQLVREGLARVGYENGKEIHLDDLKKAEQEAVKEKKNIWSIEGYVEKYRFNNK